MLNPIALHQYCNVVNWGDLFSQGKSRQINFLLQPLGAAKVRHGNVEVDRDF